MKTRNKFAKEARGLILQIKVLILPLFFILLIPMNPSPTVAFVPENERIVLNLLFNGSTDVVIGEQIELIIQIKNFTNNTMKNITLTQTLPSSINLIKTPFSNLEGTESNFTNVDVFEEISKSGFAVTYINATSSNFTMNFNTLLPQQSVGFSYTVNATEEGLFTINEQSSSVTERATRINYFDHFQDPQLLNGQNEIIIQVSEITLNEKLGSFPDVDIEEIEINTIILIAGIVLIVALLSRSLYFKKPIDI